MFHSFKLGKMNMTAALGVIVLVAMAILALDSSRSDATLSVRNGGLNQTTSTKADAKKAKRRSGMAPRFGARVLREGMRGGDVKVLKSIVRAKSMLVGSRVSRRFDRPTTSAVKRFQRNVRLRRNGVVNRATARKMVRSLGAAGASWYGPGFWGNRTACGQKLRPRTIGVAHRNLPCGSKVLIGYRGRYAIAPVIDRGPFIRGRTWDLTLALSDAIGFTPAGVAKVRHAVIHRKR